MKNILKFVQIITKHGKKFLLPIRFMVICEKGHIDDFLFIEWTRKISTILKNVNYVLLMEEVKYSLRM